jgi:hypothetical protein
MARGIINAQDRKQTNRTCGADCPFFQKIPMELKDGECLGGPPAMATTPNGIVCTAPRVPHDRPVCGIFHTLFAIQLMHNSLQKHHSVVCGGLDGPQSDPSSATEEKSGVIVEP